MPEPDLSPAPPADAPDADATPVAPPEPTAPEPLAAGATCPNCGAPPAGPYCQGCGQRRLDERLTLRRLWREASSRVFNLDRGLLHTLARLAGGPGRVPADYVAGRRRRYTHPLSFYLLAATISLFSIGLYQEVVLSETGQAPMVSFEVEERDGTTADSTASARERLAAATERLNGDDGVGLIRQAVAYQRRVGTPLLVFFALFAVLPLRLVFGPARNLAETAVFSLYVIGFTTLAVAVVVPVVFHTLPILAATVVVGVGTLAAYAGVGVWGASVFWTPGWATTVKAGFAFLLGYAVYSTVLGVVALGLVLSRVLDEAGLGWRDLLSL